MRNKYLLMRGIRNNNAIPSISESDSMTMIETSLYRDVPLTIAEKMTLRLRNEQLADCQRELNLIRENISKCEYIPNCRGFLHLKPSGCPECGVVHIGGSLSLTQYVRSTDRSSGVIKLVRLEFELEALRDEEVTRRGLLRECTENLQKARDTTFNELLVHFQRWWCARRAVRQIRRETNRIQRSLFYFRIRRLSRMKKEMDSVCVGEIDVPVLLVKYSELIPEFEEYIAKKKRELNGIVERVGRVFLSKMRTKVLKTRRRKLKREKAMQQLLRTVDANSASRLVVKNIRMMRKRVELLDGRSWMCNRVECSSRRFLSEDRYSVHMRIHAVTDADNASKDKKTTILNDTNASLKFESQQALVVASHEETALSRIQASARYLQAHPEPTGPLFAAPSPHISMLHIRSIDSWISPLYHLELMSKRSAIRLVSDMIRIPLELSVTRIGCNSLCEIQVSCQVSSSVGDSSEVLLRSMTASKSDSRLTHSTSSQQQLPDIADKSSSTEASLSPQSHSSSNPISGIHCILFCSKSTTVDDSTDSVSAHQNKSALTVVDNSTSSGTYVISSRANGMALRAPNKSSAGLVLHPGDLLCVGVVAASLSQKKSFPPPMLNATEASTACLVFKIRCIDLEHI